MFEINPNTPYFLGNLKVEHLSNDNVRLVHRAVQLFNEAISRGRTARFKRLLTRSSGQLLDLNTMPERYMRSQHYGGLRSVSIKKICGSLGRITDFDRDFNPLDGRLRERWQNIAIAHLHNAGLSPVELIQVGECYFVQDGHHRISVARALGQWAIDAEVIVWEIPLTLHLEDAHRAEARIVQLISS